MKNLDEPIVIEQTFEASVEKLWNAITEVTQMKKWFFENIKTFKPEEGFETRFIVENKGRIFPHLWKITKVEPHKKIIYNWRYEGYTGDSFVTFELSEIENGSQLTLIHQITENFPEDIPEFRRESCIGGWNWFIKQNLKNYLKEKNG